MNEPDVKVEHPRVWLWSIVVLLITATVVVFVVRSARPVRHEMDWGWSIKPIDDTLSEELPGQLDAAAERDIGEGLRFYAGEQVGFEQEGRRADFDDSAVLLVDRGHLEWGFDVYHGQISELKELFRARRDSRTAFLDEQGLDDGMLVSDAWIVATGLQAAIDPSSTEALLELWGDGTLTDDGMPQGLEAVLESHGETIDSAWAQEHLGIRWRDILLDEYEAAKTELEDS